MCFPTDLEEAEFQAWLDGGTQGLEQFYLERANFELAELADGTLSLVGQVEAALVLGDMVVLASLTVAAHFGRFDRELFGRAG